MIFTWVRMDASLEWFWADNNDNIVVIVCCKEAGTIEQLGMFVFPVSFPSLLNYFKKCFVFFHTMSNTLMALQILWDDNRILFYFMGRLLFLSVACWRYE